MKKIYTTLCLLATILVSCGEFGKKEVSVKKEFEFASSQFDLLIAETRKVMNRRNAEQKEALVSPRTVEANKLVLNVAREWTTGFFPGSLWYMYEYTKDEKWANEARTFMADIESQKNDQTTHDLGFKIYCSFGNAYRLTNDDNYKNVVITAANTLAKRYCPVAKTIRSWDWNKEEWQCPVIIDNMMNLEMLFWAAKETNDSRLYDIAVNHANTTMKNHFRDDYSSYHVVDYDTISGAVRMKMTHQGFSDASAWARGQAWAIYGYTMCYRFTKDVRYLEQAKNIVNYYFSHSNLPKDLIPYWDFNAPETPYEQRDASAATITASALYELSLYDAENSEQYRDWADTILQNLSQKYKPEPGGAKGFLLLHSTGNKPRNSEIDVPLVYADYYYLEALLRKRQIEKTGSL